MFVADADPTCLRQGDILAGLPYLLIRPQALTAIGMYHHVGGDDGAPLFKPITSTHREDPEWLTVQSLGRLGFAAVISQCCDLAPRNGRVLLPTIALARLVPITVATLNDPVKLASLRTNKDPRDNDDPGVIKLFCLAQHEKLGGTEWTVDYNQLFSIPSNEYPAILANRVLQMTDEARIRFKIKLAWCLGRLTDEEIESGHPWIEPEEPEPALPADSSPAAG
jgi:hypothetical protein